jgi:hypothetical protein
MGMFSKKTDPAEWGLVSAGGSTRTSSSPQAGAYGIEETIRLMRGLPVEQHLELVVRVVKSTLESVNVRIPTIIEEATRKEQLIGQQIASLSGEIAGFEAEIAKRRHAMDQLQQDLAETTKVKERLELAEGSGMPAPPPAQALGPFGLRPVPPPAAPPKHPPSSFRPVLRPRTTSSSDDAKEGAVDAKADTWDGKVGTDDTKPTKSSGDGDDTELKWPELR